jgi:L,D-transpeptidase catalytic domain
MLKSFKIIILLITVQITSGCQDSSQWFFDENNELQFAEQTRVGAPEYFMIQNIATEKLRVYEKQCTSSSICSHQLVLEADMAAGEIKSKSILGHFKITEWNKFYQDGAGTYPSWYDPTLASVPEPGSSPVDWAKKRLLREGQKDGVRGAFGWYTAKVGPNSQSQWTHGTIGWGADRDRYIQETRKGLLVNLLLDPRSHGCSRTDNETIAYIRTLLPVGATVVKVYAKEELEDPSLREYREEQGQWNYIMTKKHVRSTVHDTADALANLNVLPSDILEKNTYTFDKHPTAKPFLDTTRGAKKSKNGNIYKIPSESFRGVFYVDTGLLKSYQHPAELPKGGYPTPLPTFLQKN